jgi:hypothetical protein
MIKNNDSLYRVGNFLILLFIGTGIISVLMSNPEYWKEVISYTVVCIVTILTSS